MVGIKLKTSAVTAAVASQIYHRFFEAASESSYDPYVSWPLTSISGSMKNSFSLAFHQLTALQLIAATSLYIASKQQDEPLKIRDLINVVHRTLNRDSDILDLTDEYWSYRDSIVQAGRYHCECQTPLLLKQTNWIFCNFSFSELLAMRMINFKASSPNIHLV